MKRNWFVVAFVCLIFLGSRAIADKSCEFGILSTSFGPQGGETITLGSHGRLSHWHDSFAVENGQRVPQFTSQSQQVSLGNLTKISAFSSQPVGPRNDPYSVTVDTNGIAKLLTPELRNYGVNFPDMNAVRTGTLYRPPLSPPKARGLETVNLSQVQSANPNYEPAPALSFYVAIDNTIYRSNWNIKEISPDTDLARALITGPVRVHPPQRMTADGPEVLRFDEVYPPIIDFSVDSNRGNLWLPIPEPGRAMEVGPLTRVLTFTNEEVMRGIDYLQALDEKHLLVASELGQIAIVDIDAKKADKKLSLNTVGWLKGVSGFRWGDYQEVWAINGMNHQIYRWTSKDLDDHLKPLATQLPEGVTPNSLSAFGQEIPDGVVLPPSENNYFSNYTPINGHYAVTRVMVAGSDGKLYGWTHEAGAAGLEKPDTERWETHPFEESNGSPLELP